MRAIKASSARAEAEAEEVGPYLFAHILHEQLQVPRVITVPVKKVSPKSCCQNTIIRQDSLKGSTEGD